MTLKQVRNMLLETGMDVAYEHFDISNVPEMPFITYSEPTSNNFEADITVLVPIKHIYVTLWMTKRDEQVESLLINVFEDHDIPWSKNVDYLEKEKCYEITFEVEV